MASSTLLQPTRDRSRINELLARVEKKLGEIPFAYRTPALRQSFLNDTMTISRRRWWRPARWIRQPNI